MTRAPPGRSFRLVGRLAGATAAMALATAAAPPPAPSPDPRPPAEAAPAFVPPAAPMLLTRTLRRPLGDGKAVVATRNYEVRFVAEGTGFRLDGKLVNVVVEAPEALRPLADLERTRPDTGLFPILLEADGSITAANDPRAPDAMASAVDTARHTLGQSGLVGLEMQEAKAFVERFRAGLAMSPWPRDLFRPTEGATRTDREVPLPDGKSGHIRIETEAAVQAPGGLLSSFRRTVTTQLDGTRRITVETWTLTPLE